ncbi:MAG: hypothetical protein NZM31_10810 [Gemmatales bacterium]|nr:hypothetical protein [Gemmatales bacterium]MDW8387487.1 hypothetical protein [Gemmatales bacterium]
MGGRPGRNGGGLRTGWAVTISVVPIHQPKVNAAQIAQPVALLCMTAMLQ